MKVWGMLSEEDESAGFDLVFDDEWFMVLKLNGQPIARFNPALYTLRELLFELESHLELMRGIPATEMAFEEMPISELGFLAILKTTDN